MRYRNLTIIGTSHIAEQSIKRIEKTIEEQKPGFIAVELDRDRFFALLHEKERGPGLGDIGKIGFKGFLFSLISAYVEKKLGSKVGVKPGAEMLAAIKLAKKHKIKIALIDQDIRITLQKFSKALTWREKFRFVADIFNSIFFRKREMKKLGLEKFDLTKVPEKKTVKKMIGFVKKRYPNIYRVLIKERDEIMAKRLKLLMKQNPEEKIVAVVGAGHEERIMRLVK